MMLKGLGWLLVAAAAGVVLAHLFALFVLHAVFEAFLGHF
jgi:hypothetical protein